MIERTIEYLEKQLKIKMDVIAELDKWHKTDKDNIALMVAENTMLKEKIVAQDVAIKNLQQELYDCEDDYRGLMEMCENGRI